jgi:hypothetical protein
VTCNLCDQVAYVNFTTAAGTYPKCGFHGEIARDIATHLLIDWAVTLIDDAPSDYGRDWTT